MISVNTKIYLAYQRHRVVLVDTNDNDIFTRRYNRVYAKNLVAHRGTDNQILIEFVNQDQKPVDVTALEFTFRIISRNGEEMLFEKTLTPVNTSRGQTKIILTENELDSITPQTCSYSIEKHEVNGLSQAMSTDEQAGGRGTFEVRDSILPAFVASADVSIPELVGPVGDYFSSIVETEASNSHTFQFDLTDFSGDINLEGAPDQVDVWYPIDSTPTYANETGSVSLTVAGFYPYVRLRIGNNTSGTVEKILYRT